MIQKRSHMLAMALATSLGITILVPSVSAETMKTYQLSDNPESPAIILDFNAGGFARAQTERKGNEPFLTISADGTVILGASGSLRRAESRIDRARLRSLVRSLLDGQALVPLGSASLGERSRSRMTPIYVFADGKVCQIDSRLTSINPYKLLLEVRNETYAGGREALDEYLRMANEELAAVHPEVQPLTVDDLRDALQTADGTRTLRFARSEVGTADQTNVEIVHPEHGDPEISATVEPMGECGL